METIELDSWEEFTEELKNLEIYRKEQNCRAEFLFRGQPDQDYELSTTLERSDCLGMSIKDYLGLIVRVKPQIESFEKQPWNILSYPEEVDGFLEEYDDLIRQGFGAGAFQGTYSYMTYLRQYGFPSPLLDWTSSPYVAAYFAFRYAFKILNPVAIFVYLESSSEIGLKVGSSDRPRIICLGP